MQSLQFVDAELKERVNSFVSNLNQMTDSDLEKQVQQYIYQGVISRPDVSYQICVCRRNGRLTHKQRQTVINELCEKLFLVRVG